MRETDGARKHYSPCMKSTLSITCEVCGGKFQLWVGEITRIQFGTLPKAIEQYLAHKCKGKK